MRLNLTVWLWMFVIMSLLLTVITISMVYIFTSQGLKLADPKYAFYKTRDESNINPPEELEFFGYRRTDVENMDWDLLWSYDYPFGKLSYLLKDLKSNQKVNHWPGTSAMVSKLEFSTSIGSPMVPKSFKIPKDLEEFRNYAKSDTNRKFLQKNIFHRNVSMVDSESVKKESANIFIQEFVQNPYLIDGYKFDMGVFVLLTSVNPLRLYIYDDVTLRFCKSKYVKNDYGDKDSYVISKSFNGIEAIPSLKQYYKTQTAKQSFDSYLRSNKQNPNLIWIQIENSIREVFLKGESKIIEALNERFSESSYENFFELYKLDFLVTDSKELKVWMMEANMSPIYSPEDVMNNMLSMVSRQNGVHVNGSPVDPLVCKENNCNSENECTEKCELCSNCLKGRKEVTVTSAYRETENQIEGKRFKRIFPKPITYDFNLEKELNELNSEMNKFMTNWYFEKCRSETKWCQ